MAIDSAEKLVHYEIMNFSKWTEFVEQESGLIDALMPPTCSWVFINEEGVEEICDYHFTGTGILLFKTGP